MAPLKLLNLLTLATLAIFSASFGVDPVNALSGQGPASNAILHSAHGAIAKRKRSRVAKRACRTRPQNGGNNTNSSNGDNGTNSTNSNSDNSDNGSTNSDNGNNTDSSNGTNSDNSNSTDSNSPTNGNGNNNGGSSSGGEAQGTGTGKICLAWANGNDPALANFMSPQSGYLYTWSSSMPQDLHGYKPAPMLWGGGEQGISDFHANVKQGSADYILGFNEPEIDGQANLTPQSAAEIWKEHIQPYASQGFKLVSPAVTSAPQSKQWLSDFLEACNTCTIDAVAVHYYDTSADGLISYITDFHTTFKKPIWLTEYACQSFNNGPQCTPDEVSEFMDKVKGFAESNDWVQQICWFGAMHDMVNVNPDNQLMAADGTPTVLGKSFLGI